LFKHSFKKLFMNRFFDLQDELALRNKKKPSTLRPRSGQAPLKNPATAKTWFGSAFSKAPRGIRNNNPGNIRINKNNDWVGKVPAKDNTDKSFEQFTHYKYGVRALIILLRNYTKSGRNTITKIFAEFAPPNENNTQAYIKFVAGRVGIGADDVITLNKDIMRELCQAIAKMENGEEAITDAQFEEGWAEVPQNIRDEMAPAKAQSYWADSFSDSYSEPAYGFSYGDGGIAYEQTKTAVKTITVVEQEPASPPDNGFLAQKAGKNPGCLRVTSVKDMVNKVLASLKPNEKIQRLVIYGHGQPGVVGLGDGMGWETGKHINSDTAWQNELKRLKGKFTEDGEIFLGGCNTGANEEGSNKLKEVADVTGVTVKAPTGKVYGDCTEEAGSQHQKGYPGSPALPPIGTPADEKKRKKESSTAHSFSMSDLKSNISAVYFQPAMSPIKSAGDAKYKFTDAQTVKKFIDGIDYSHTVNVKGVSGKLSGQVFLIRNGVPEEYVVFSDCDYFLKKGDWTKAYEVKLSLKTMLKGLMEDRNNLFV
jgi:hypothetical protein